MPKLEIPLSQEPYASPYSSLGKEIVDNFYLEASASPTAAAKFYLVGAQGLRRMIERTTDNPCRGMITVSSGRTFGVWGNGLFEILTNGTSRAQIGTLLTSAGIVRFAENGYQMIAVDGSYGYILDLTSGAWAQITDQYFPGIDGNDPTKGPSHVVCIDTYFLVNSRNTNRYYWSAPYYIPYAFDAQAPSIKYLWWGLDYGEKVGDTDLIQGMVPFASNRMAVFGINSTEFHVNTGNTRGQLFQRMESAVIGTGAMSPDAIVYHDSAVYWLGRDRSGVVGMFACGTDYQPKRISLRGIETRIQQYATLADAWAFVYSMDGHTFIVWNFPSGTSVDGGDPNGATWIYDLTTTTWTRRTRWDSASGESFRWRGWHATQNFGKLLLGCDSTDALFELSSTHFVNDHPTGAGVDYINRALTAPILYNEGKNVVVRTVQLRMQQGTALRSGQGSTPQAMMAMSKDAGQTFGYERFAPMGQTGEYAQRTRWLKCGISRNPVIRFRITEPIQVVVVGCVVDVESLST